MKTQLSKPTNKVQSIVGCYQRHHHMFFYSISITSVSHKRGFDKK